MKEVGLTRKDIDTLANTLSVGVKSETIKKIGYYYNNTQTITEEEKRIAEDIFRIMVRDFEVKVREVLVDTIKSSKNIPHDIIAKIVQDTDTVSVPFIRDYEALSKDDLVNIINFQNENKQKAVAMRQNLPSEVASHIAEVSSEGVVEILLENKTAKIEEKAYDTIVNRYTTSEGIKEKIVNREILPIPVVEKILNNLSEILQKKLLFKHNLPDNIVSDIVEQVHDKVTLKISQEYSSDRQIELFVSQLYRLNKLSSSLVVRSICLGDVKFFEYALCLLANKPINDVRKVLFTTKDDFIIRNLLRDAKIPTNMFVPVIASLKIAQELNFDIGKKNKDTFSKRVIERILTHETLNEKLDISDIEYLITKIS
ncbi:MAG: DUF2336 domain-containing protein [Alphaproteobacteria bacterium]|nr:DUF2336 domain-containing protein [Alphaproteobacteria bacterium]